MDTRQVENEIIGKIKNFEESINIPAGYDASILETIFYKGIMPSEKVLDLPVDCNTLTGSVNL